MTCVMQASSRAEQPGAAVQAIMTKGGTFTLYENDKSAADAATSPGAARLI